MKRLIRCSCHQLLFSVMAQITGGRVRFSLTPCKGFVKCATRGLFPDVALHSVIYLFLAQTGKKKTMFPVSYVKDSHQICFTPNIIGLLGLRFFPPLFHKLLKRCAVGYCCVAHFQACLILLGSDCKMKNMSLVVVRLPPRLSVCRLRLNLLAVLV